VKKRLYFYSCMDNIKLLWGSNLILP